ncbi:MAG TPA: hypothetical protein VEI03_08290 [Stellaceae bacterium]|nr:hypothetical protein [Stellaceae bacterium]
MTARHSRRYRLGIGRCHVDIVISLDLHAHLGDQVLRRGAQLGERLACEFPARRGERVRRRVEPHVGDDGAVLPQLGRQSRQSAQVATDEREELSGLPFHRRRVPGGNSASISQERRCGGSEIAPDEIRKPLNLPSFPIDKSPDFDGRADVKPRAYELWFPHGRNIPVL